MRKPMRKTMSELMRTSKTLKRNLKIYISYGSARVGVLLTIAMIALVAVAIYMFWWTTIVNMKIFKTLFGNGWYYIYLIIIGGICSILDIPLFKTGEKDIIYVNIGGCVIPVIITAYLLYKYNPLFDLLVLGGAILITVIVSRAVSFYVKGAGVFGVSIVVELLSVFLAIRLNTEILNRLAFGYVIATIGVIVGGDLLHIGMIGRDGRWSDKLSIGGAGIKDGIWSIGFSTMFLILVFNMFFGW